MGTVQNRGFKHCENTEWSSVLVCGFREVGEIVVRIVDEGRVIIHRSNLVELLGLVTCEANELGQVAKLLILVRVRLTCALRSGKFGRIVWTGASVRS